MERTIKVTGNGKLSIKPDTIRLDFTLSALRPDYDAAVNASKQDKSDLSHVLTGLGFDRSDLKTTYFNVDSEYDSYRDNDGSRKERFLGCKYRHNMKLEFPVDNALLGRLLFGLTQLRNVPEFSISHTLRDPESARNELLSLAVADSANKARVLAAAAGVCLGEIRCIDYARNTTDFHVCPFSRMMHPDSFPNSELDFDIDSENIDAEDFVTVTWDIK